MKRKLEQFKIDNEYIKNCKRKFNNSNTNKLAKNIITNVGILHGSTDHEETTKVSHIFLNSIKKKNLKATNQGISGRCWLFSGLNMFRHHVIKALDLTNFEFSETYLYFWDKFERSNSYLQWTEEYILKNKVINTDDHFYKYLVDRESWMSDGGYWNFFVNLVNKYGVIPKDAMPETFQSEYSTEMNETIMKILHIATIDMIKNINKTNKIKLETRDNIFNILVKFLGEPPKTFRWNFTNENDEPTSIDKLTPFTFKELVIPGIDLNDFVLLSNIPSDKYQFYKKYSIKNSNNVIEGNKCQPINIPIKDIKLMAKKSILNGMPVWFGADVNKDFHPLFSTLNTNLINSDLLLGKNKKIDKKDRFFITEQKTTHAMTFVGVNLDNKGNTTSWQVENSWGYFDNETPGLDGFLCMNDEWFDEYVGEVVIHKKFLSRKVSKILDDNVIEIEPWESVAPALKVQGDKFYNMNYKLYKDINNPMY